LLRREATGTALRFLVTAFGGRLWLTLAAIAVMGCSGRMDGNELERRLAFVEPARRVAVARRVS
jgi:hypothetical protein